MLSMYNCLVNLGNHGIVGRLVFHVLVHGEYT